MEAEFVLFRSAYMSDARMHLGAGRPPLGFGPRLGAGPKGANCRGGGHRQNYFGTVANLVSMKG